MNFKTTQMCSMKVLGNWWSKLINNLSVGTDFKPKLMFSPVHRVALS
jgi:hypothetical protein